MVETYSLDIDPAQIVAWLLAEERLRAFDLLVSASRSYEIGELRGGESNSLSNEDREELTEVLEVGELEVRPRHEPHRWTLRIRVEDDIGPRLPEDEPVPEEEEEIDLQAFADEFVIPDRGVAEVTVEAESDRDKASFDQVFSAILHDRHGRRSAAPAASAKRARAGRGKRPGARQRR
jgi:rhodanese-related sulfurtransferase